jgi:Cyclin, N-terminal domain
MQKVLLAQTEKIAVAITTILNKEKPINNENSNPYWHSEFKSTGQLKKLSHSEIFPKQTEQDEEDNYMDMQMESLAAQFLPDYRFFENQNNNQITDNNLYNIDPTDNLGLEKYCYKAEESELEEAELWSYSSDNYDYNMWYGTKRNSSSPSRAKYNWRNEDPEDESEEACKMLNYLISIEAIYTPASNYLETIQLDISPIMRAILLDWMMEVWNEFTLKRETVYYSINYVDRYLSVHPKVK